ncbi:hypothetical protein HKD37_01G002385 [Glycine soja]
MPRVDATKPITHAYSPPCRQQQAPHAPRAVLHHQPTRTVVSLNNLLSVVVHYGRTAALHDKLLEHRDMTLFEMGVESYGSAMVARKRQPTVFALWMTTKLGEFCRNRPWNPDITFGNHGLKPQHLEDKVFLMGQRMLGGRK